MLRVWVWAVVIGVAGCGVLEPPESSIGNIPIVEPDYDERANNIPQLAFGWDELGLEPRFYCGESDIRGYDVLTSTAGFNIVSVGRLAAPPENSPFDHYLIYLENNENNCRFYSSLHSRPSASGRAEVSAMRFNAGLLAAYGPPEMLNFVRSILPDQLTPCFDLSLERRAQGSIDGFPPGTQTCLVDINQWLDDNILMLNGWAYGDRVSIGYIMLHADGVFLELG